MPVLGERAVVLGASMGGLLAARVLADFYRTVTVIDPGSGFFSATSDFGVISQLDTVNICVPTPLRKTKDPDMSYIVSACQQIAKYFHKEKCDGKPFAGQRRWQVFPRR